MSVGGPPNNGGPDRPLPSSQNMRLWPRLPFLFGPHSSSITSLPSSHYGPCPRPTTRHISDFLPSPSRSTPPSTPPHPAPYPPPRCLRRWGRIQRSISFMSYDRVRLQTDWVRSVNRVIRRFASSISEQCYASLVGPSSGMGCFWYQHRTLNNVNIGRLLNRSLSGERKGGSRKGNSRLFFAQLFGYLIHTFEKS